MLTEGYAYANLKMNNNIMPKEFVDFVVNGTTIDGKTKSQRNLMKLLWIKSLLRNTSNMDNMKSKIRFPYIDRTREPFFYLILKKKI